MIGTPNLTEVDERIYSGEEGTVKPSPSLRYEFGDGI